LTLCHHHRLFEATSASVKFFQDGQEISGWFVVRR